MRAYERKDFEFIVSMTAKDRELTSSGLQALEPALTSFETLLDGTLEVLGFPESRTERLEVKEKKVRDLLEGTKGLLYIDNLDGPRRPSFSVLPHEAGCLSVILGRSTARSRE